MADGMDLAQTTSLLDELNAMVDAAELLRRIGYATDKIQVVGETVKAFCPIHRDARFRSLLIDVKAGSYKCTIKTCAGHDGGNLLDLLAKVRGVDMVAAAAAVIEELELQPEPAWIERMTGVLLDMATQARDAGDIEGAQDAARRALQFCPDSVKVRTFIAELHSATGDLVQACDELLALADSLITSGRAAEADSILDRAAQLRPESEDVLFMQIRSAEAQGQRERERALLKEIAHRREQAGREADNLGVYQKLIEVSPEEPTLRLKLAAIHEMRRDIKSATRELETVSFQMLEQGRGAEAIPLIEKVLQFEPQRTKLRLALVEELVREGEYERAKNHVFTSVDAMIERSDFASAIETVNKWVEIEPDCLEAHVALVRAYQGQDQQSDAIRHLRTAAELATRSGAKDQALEFLYRVKFLQPDDVALRRDIIARLLEAGRLDNAIFEMMDLAETLKQQDRGVEARETLLSAATISGSPNGRMQLAAAMHQDGLTPNAAEVLLSVVAEAEDTGDEESMEAALRLLEEIDPENLDLAVRRWRRLWEGPDAAQAALVARDLARRLREAGRETDAGRLAVEAADHGRTHPAAAPTLVEMLLDCGFADRAVELYPVAADVLREADGARLLALARRLTTERPEAKAVWRDLAALLSGSGETEAALDAVRRVLELCETEGDAAGELAAIDQGLSIAPEDLELLHRRVGALLRAGGEPASAQEAAAAYLQRVRDQRSPAEFAEAALAMLRELPDLHETRLETADVLHQLGRSGDAAALCREVLAWPAGQRPSDSVCLSLRRKLLALEPSDYTTLFELALNHVALNETDAAIPLLGEVVRQALERGDPETALRAAGQALGLRPGDPDLMEWLARAQKAAGRRAEFEKTLADLVACGRCGLAVEWFAERAHAAMADSNWKEGETLVKKWMDLAPDDAEAVERFAEVCLHLRRTPKAVEHFERAAALHRAAGRLDRSISALTRGLDADPDSVALRQALLQALLDAGREDEAIEQMQQLADTLIDRRDYRDASAILARILEYRTNSADTVQRLASLVYENEGFEKAAPHFRKLIAIRAASMSPEEVAAEYEKVLALDGATVEFRVEYAEHLDRVGMKAEAKEQLLLIAQTFRDELNDPVRAIQFFGRATSIKPDPSDARIFEELASLHQSLNVPVFAGEALREAVRLYKSAGDTERAIAAQRRLTELSGAGDYKDYVHLSELLVAAGRKAEAAEAQRFAVALAEESGACSRAERLSLCERLHNLDALDIECAMKILDLLSRREAGSRVLEMARMFAGSGKPREAVRLLERGKAMSPESLEVRRQLAAVRRETGDPAGLFAELLELARVALEKKDRKEASKALNEAASLAPAQDAAFDLAALLAAAGETERAVAMYCAAAKNLAAAGRADEAAAALRTAIGLDASAVPAPAIAAMLRDTKGAKPLRAVAEEILEQALKARSRTRTLVLAAALLEESGVADRRKVLSTVFERAGAGFLAAVGGAHADWLVENGAVVEAIETCDHLIQLAGNSPDVWWLRSQVLRKVGQREEAAAAAKMAAQMYAKAGAVTEEEQAYSEVLRDFPDDVQTLETLVYFYEREQRLPDAATAMRRLVQLAEDRGDQAAAAKWLARLVQTEGADAATRERLAGLLAQTGQTDQAIVQLLEAARACREQKDDTKAMAMLERVLVMDPACEAAVTQLLEMAREAGDAGRVSRHTMQLADIKADKGEVEAACSLVKQQCDEDPENLRALEKLAGLYKRAHNLRGYCHCLKDLGNKYAKRGEYALAVKHFDSLAAEKPDDTSILEMIIDCCARGGMQQHAAETAQRLLERCLGGADARRVKSAAETVLRFDETNPAAHKALGEALIRLNQATDAMPHLRKAASLYRRVQDTKAALSCIQSVTVADPENPSAWAEYADLLAASGDSEAARIALFQVADLEAGAGNIQKAEAAIFQAMKFDPEDSLAHERAAGVYRRCNRGEPLVTELVWLTNYYLRVGDYQTAEERASEGLQFDPVHPVLLDARIKILRYLGRTEELALRLGEMAQAALESGQDDRALSLLEELRALTPTAVSFRKKLGDLYTRLGRHTEAAEELSFVVSALLNRMEYDEARATADMLTASRPGDLALHVRLADEFASHRVVEAAAKLYLKCAELAKSAGDLKASVGYMRKALEHRPRWAEGWRELAAELAAAGQPEEAAKAWRRVEDIHIEDRQFVEAAAALKEQIHLVPTDPEPRHRLVRLHERTGNRAARAAEMAELAALLAERDEIEEAVTLYKQLIILRPDDTELLQRYIELFAQVGSELEIVPEYLRLARAYAQKGQFVEATRTYEQVLAIDRVNVDARRQFIDFLLTTGQRSRGVLELRKVAGIYRAAGKLTEAIEALTTAHGLEPYDGDLCMSAAEVCEQAGNQARALDFYALAAAAYADSFAAKAVGAYNRYLELAPDHVEIRQAFVNLLQKIGDNALLQENARKLASAYESRGEPERAEMARKIAASVEMDTPESLQARIEAHAGDPKQQYYDWIRLGDLLVERGDIERALEAYRKARALNDDVPDLIRKYIDALVQISPEHEAIPDFLALAERYFGTGDYTRAVEVYEHVLRLDPRNAAARSGKHTAEKMTRF